MQASHRTAGTSPLMPRGSISGENRKARVSMLGDWGGPTRQARTGMPQSMS
jgi:hypothetical protein